MKIDPLKSFILTRDPQYKTKSKLPKKGTVTGANEGEINLISISFKCRTNKNYGKYSPAIRDVEEEDGEALDEIADPITVYRMWNLNHETAVRFVTNWHVGFIWTVQL